MTLSFVKVRLQDRVRFALLNSTVSLLLNAQCGFCTEKTFGNLYARLVTISAILGRRAWPGRVVTARQRLQCKHSIRRPIDRGRILREEGRATGRREASSVVGTLCTADISHTVSYLSAVVPSHSNRTPIILPPPQPRLEIGRQFGRLPPGNANDKTPLRRGWRDDSSFGHRWRDVERQRRVPSLVCLRATYKLSSSDLKSLQCQNEWLFLRQLSYSTSVSFTSLLGALILDFFLM